MPDLPPRVLAAALLALLAGCGELNTPAHPVSLRLVARGDQLVGGELRLSDGDDALVIRRSRMVLREVRLQDTQGRDQVVARGRLLAEMDLSGAPVALAEVLVPPGTYTTVVVALDASSSAGPSAIGDEQLADFDGVSVIVDGAYNGASFELREPLTTELKFPLRAPVEIRADASVNLDIVTSPGSWFLEDPTDPRSDLLDPGEESDRRKISENLLGAFDVHGESRPDGSESQEDGT